MSYFMLLKSLGFELPTSNDTYSHFEDRFIHDTFTTTGGAATAAGVQQTYTIAAGSITTLGGVDYKYPRKWDIVMYPNEVTGSIVDITGNVITVRPNDVLDPLPLVASGDEFVIIGNAFAEGTDETTSRISGTDEYTNYVQIIKEALTATGSEMTNADWFDEISSVNKSGAKQILGYIMKGHLDLDYRSALAASTALLFQKITTNTAIVDAASVAANNRVKTTQGLIPAIRGAGNIQNYTAGSFSVNVFDEINKTLDQEFCGDDLVGLLGFGLQTEIDNTMVDYFKDSEMNYVISNTFNGDAGLAMSVGFKSLKKGDRTFNFKRMGLFSHPKVGGAAGYNFTQKGLFLPIDRRRDAKTGDMIPSIGSRYKKLGQYNRQMETFNLSGAGPGLKVLAKDLANWYQRQHLGAQHCGVNRFVLVEPS